jgi:hypothetical protein
MSGVIVNFQEIVILSGGKAGARDPTSAGR